MLVSVIIPTYNRGKTIGRAVDSVLAQSWKSMEIIVVDSHSTDATGEVLAAYGDKIRLVHGARRGPAAGRNVGIKAARGEVISFLDSDDEWLPDKLERQMKLLEAGEAAGVKCCVCNARKEVADGSVTSFAIARLRPAQREGVWFNPAEVLTTRFLFFNQVVAIRREVLEQTGYFREDMPLNEDYDLALRLAVTGPWAFIADPLVVWHEHAENGSRAFGALEICQSTLQILNDLRSSSQFGPLLPAGLLRRRIRILNQTRTALRISTGTNAVARWSGKCLLSYLRVCEALYRRSPSTPRMVTDAL